MKKKIILLIIIILVTYNLAWTINIHYSLPGKGTIFEWSNYSWSFFDDSRHVVGYYIIGYFFGWISLIFGILDEAAQFLVKHKGASFYQMALNVGSAIIGIMASKVIILTFRNPFKKKGGKH